jgi:hypothetical protein
LLRNKCAKTQANALKAGQDVVFNHGNDWQDQNEKAFEYNLICKMYQSA